MITESKVTEIFCIADDFCKEFDGEMVQKMHFRPQLTLPKAEKGKKAHDVGCRGHHDLICFHFNSYRNFKHYYLGCVRIHWKHLCFRRHSPTTASWRSCPDVLWL